MRLPEGVKAVWDLGKTYRETTPTRERVCINGLWRWQPAGVGATAQPTGRWGALKVPGPWSQAGERGDQMLYAHPDWRGGRPEGTDVAWYEREVAIPADWAGRRIAVQAEYVNSQATVYVDGRAMGDIYFPGGELDVTAACRPGRTHRLTLRVEAKPLRAVVLSYAQTNEEVQVRGRVARKGLCGDVFLAGMPAGARIEDVKIDTSVRNWEITFGTALAALAEGTQYTLRADVTDGGAAVATFTSEPFGAADLREGRFTFAAPWQPEKLWDLHTPGNTYDVQVSLLESGGQLRDAGAPVRFGFREFWVNGRDFYLNGTRIFCPLVPFENANRNVHLATYEATCESLRRLRSMGINTVFTHYYNCQPGAHLSLPEVLRAADDVGMLVALSQPHPRDYEWDEPDADEANGYARHAGFYVRAAQNHPSVVMYAVSHNSTSYSEDMNPDQIGIDGPIEETAWTTRNRGQALRGEAIVRRLDGSRVIYHHSSGNLSGMYTSNFYLNFVPIQERSDWFDHWSKQGQFPILLVEYGPPLPPTWTTYRGWYKGKRTFLSADVPWEVCTAEYSAQFLGDRAYDLTEKEKENLRFETAQFRAGRTWQRWEYPYGFNSSRFAVPNRCDVQAMYIKDNWPAFRTLGVSGPSGWSFDRFWMLPDDFEAGDERLPVNWDDLQKPGYSVDLVPGRGGRVDSAYEFSDWIATSAAEAYVHYNQPFLAYIGGKEGAPTGKGHNFRPGETVEKQIILINNTRRTLSCDCTWRLALPEEQTGQTQLAVETGEIACIPMHVPLPADLAPGTYPLALTVATGDGEPLQDALDVHVLPPIPAVEPAVRRALFDPRGETAALMDELGVPCDPVDANADLTAYDVLIIGKGALTVDGPAPDIGRVRDGLRVIMFEQTADALEKRLGFRVQEYGLRRTFARVPGHPLLNGLQNENLRDWQGEATLLPPRLNYEMWRQHGPSVVRSGIKVTRPWRAGCRGNVASVLIERPARGDFLPIVDGGFNLQYSPLMVYREGKGAVILCQMDVTGRTEPDPAGAQLIANILNYAASYTPEPQRTLLYAGDPAGRAHLEAAGLSPAPYEGGQPSPDQVLVAGPGAGAALAPHARQIAQWLGAGGHALALGLSGTEASAFLPVAVRSRSAEHICTQFEPPAAGSPLAGTGPADVHNRDPRELQLVTGGASPLGNGALAVAGDGRIVLCQMAPWQFDYERYYNQKRTFRKTSCLVTRLLGNMGAQGETPLLERIGQPSGKGEQRWLDGFYLEAPEEFDDPYRFFRW